MASEQVEREYRNKQIEEIRKRFGATKLIDCSMPLHIYLRLKERVEILSGLNKNWDLDDVIKGITEEIKATNRIMDEKAKEIDSLNFHKKSMDSMLETIVDHYINKL